MSQYIFITLFLIVLIYGIYKKVNCYKCFLEGAKEGVVTTINMFSSLLTFMIAISFLISSGIIEYLRENFKFKYGLILVQVIVRPISSSSSLSILLDCYNNYGCDSFIAILSTMIHYVSDASLYIIPFYLSMFKINDNNKLLFIGVLTNLFSYLVTIILVVLFYKMLC